MNFGNLSAIVCGSRFSSKNAKNNSVRRQQRQRERMPLKPNEGNAVRVPYLRCQKCQPPSHPHHPNSQPPTLCLAQHPNPMLYRKQRLCRLPQRPHSQPLNSQQRHCQQIRKRASKTLCQSRNMDRKNRKTIRTTDIAKILSHAPSLTLRCDVRNDIANTLRTLWVGLFGQRPTAYAQSRKWVAQTVENNYEVESSKELLIRLSWVRPPLVPPYTPRSFAKDYGVFCCSHTPAHSSHTFFAGIDLRRCCDFATRSACGSELVQQWVRV